MDDHPPWPAGSEVERGSIGPSVFGAGEFVARFQGVIDDTPLLLTRSRPSLPDFAGLSLAPSRSLSLLSFPS